MRCEKSKRLISEDLDGRLSEGPAGRLRAHLDGCLDCRGYRAGLEKIQAAAVRSAAAGPGPEYFAASMNRLRTALAAEEAPQAGTPAPFPGARRRLAWAGSASLAMAGAIVFFAFFRDRTPLEIYSLAYDEPLASFEHRLADSPDVAAEFDKSVRAAIQASDRTRAGDAAPLLIDHALEFESLSDEEAVELDSALQAELSRTQGKI
jgi:hypothetical protein